MRRATEVFSAFLSIPSDSLSAEAAMELLAAAEGLLRKDNSDYPDAAAWHQYLNHTGHHSFLQMLPSRECRYRWAETTFQAILKSGYSLETMLTDRVRSTRTTSSFVNLSTVRRAHGPTQRLAVG